MAMIALFVLLVTIVATRDGGSSDRAERAARDRAASEGRDLPGPVSEALRDMSVKRKVAQLMLVGPEGTGTGDPVLETLGERGYAGVVLDADNYTNPGGVDDLAREAVSDAENGDQLPPWVMAEQEGGEFNAFADLPPDDPPADLESPRDAANVAEEAAEALGEVGITGILGPVVDVGTESGSALGARLYSDDPDRVSDYALATVKAFDEADLFAAAKHFPGLGAASQAPEVGAANVGLTLEELAERDLVPFEDLIEAGVPGIVVGHGLYGVEDFVTPASTSETILTDVLRDDLGFKGVAITDDLTSPAITGAFTPAGAAVDAVRAGADIVYVSTANQDQTDVYDALLKAVRSERISPERLDQAVTRVLVAKESSGLLRDEDEGGERGSRGGGGSDGSGSSG